MIEIGDRASFGEIGLGIFRLRDQLGVRDLDGNGPVQLLILGQIDKAEAAFAEDLLDAVATDVLWLRSGNGGGGALVFAARMIISGLLRVVHSAVRYCVSLLS